MGDPRRSRPATGGGPAGGDRARGGLAAVVAAAAAAVTVVAVLAWLFPGFAGDRLATCRDAGCFCEAIGSGLLLQPSDALSSLAFCAAGAFVLARGRRLGRHTREWALVPALALTLVALGAGSFAYHARLTYAGQLLDVQGMYLLGVLLLVGGLWRGDRLSGRPAALLAGALLVGLAGAQWVWPELRRVLFAVVLGPGILVEARLAPRSVPLRAGLVAFLLGYAAWQADERGWWCDPGSWWQGHALWHVLTALSGALVVEHYRVTARDSRGS